ncbi:enoyl-CoA hydratase/isomerase family protein [Subtercola lobariae]|uniref:Enoyl-CoA hydratase n=1 Tax=Subtercola lobariae TaxID=1588641 RepID=A0A917B0M0_9MICO|nr:enoyl-CoA hydratase/isomerase family protein [Subtercola lobariae]GGF14833.1 enoyl-CoA hydratase [Subtercola lobariae]
MTAPSVLVEQHGSVRWLILNRPEHRNAMNDDMIGLLSSHARDAEQDSATSVIVVAGEGKSFSAGGDFRHFLAMDESEGILPFLERVSECFARIEASTKPWIAAIQGHAVAGGLELALVCDAVIAAHGTLIGDAHLNNRLLPGAGSSVRLERAIGKANARWMHLSGELQQAEEFTAIGWIRDVVPINELRSRAQRLALRLAAHDQAAQQNMKRLLLSLEDRRASEGLRRELEAFGDNWVEHDVPSALRAFLSTRTTQNSREIDHD